MADGFFGGGSVNSDNKRKHLVDCFKIENKNLVQAIEQFHQSDMTVAARLETCDKVIQICKRLLAAGAWHESNFLRTVIKPVEDTLESMQTIRENLQLGETAAEVDCAVDDRGMVEVFISIYQADGRDLKKWELLVKSLPDYLLGRPVYGCEEAVKAFIRSKSDRSTEAYVRALVPKSAIISSVLAVKKDRLGHVLLNLSPHALKKDHISLFYHLNHCYPFKNNSLAIDLGRKI